MGKYFLFLQIFFFRAEKKGLQHSRSFWYIYKKNLQKEVVYMISSQKNTQFKKKNRPKRSPGSQDIEVLKRKVAREVVGGPKGPIVIIVEVIQCKVD